MTQLFWDGGSITNNRPRQKKNLALGGAKKAFYKVTGT